MTLSAFMAGLPRKRMAAGVLLTDAAGRFLLVEPSYKPDWEIPGGSVEQDEPPRAAAVRELREELGLTVDPGRLLVVDWVPPAGERTEGLMLIFDGGVVTPERAARIVLPTAELRSWAFCTEQQAGERLAARLHRRVVAAARARAAGTTLYLENGLPAEP